MNVAQTVVIISAGGGAPATPGNIYYEPDGVTPYFEPDGTTYYYEPS